MTEPKWQDTKYGDCIERKFDGNTIEVVSAFHRQYPYSFVVYLREEQYGHGIPLIRLPKQDALDIANFIIEHCEKDTVT